MASPLLAPTKPGPSFPSNPGITVRLAPPEFSFPEWWNTPRDVLKSDSASRRQLTVTGEGSLIPVTVGRDRVGGSIVDVFTWSGKLIIVSVWGVGPNEAIEQVFLGSEPFTGTVRHYLGGNTEAIDPTLSAARPLYTANPTDICFSVFEVSSNYDTDRLTAAAIIKGRNDIWDPRLSGGAGANAYTTNAALVLGWYVSEVLGETVNQTDLETCAEAADAALDTLSGSQVNDRGKYRHRIGLSFFRGQPKIRQLLQFQEYAQVFLAREGGTVRMFPAQDEAAAGSIGPGDVIAGTFEKSIEGQSRIPNVVSVVYTDINGTEWKDKPYSTLTDFPPAGGVPIREERVTMPGIQSLAQAKRWAIERLNKYQLSRLRGSFEMRDQGITYLRGQIINLTDNEGAAAKPVRLTNNEALGKGHWRYTWHEHDPAIQSDVVVSEPSVPDTVLPSPNAVPNVSGLTLSVTAPKFQTGIYLSTIKAAWSALADYPYEHHFEAVFRQAGQIVGSVPTSELEAHFGPLQEGVTYDVEVRAIGVFGRSSPDATSASIAVTGKDFPPTDVPDFVAFGVGGEVRMRWGQAVDNQEIWRYEIRYGTAGVAWDDAIFLTRTDSLGLVATEIPVGTWDVLIKAIDNAFNESANAARQAGVEVDQASDVFLLDSVDAGRASSTLMTEQGDGSWVVDSGETWNDLFPNAMSTYTNALFSYQAPGAAEFVSEELDPAAGDLSGGWQALPTTVVLTGAPTEELELYDGSVWTGQGANSVVESGQKARWKMSGSGSVFIVYVPVEIRLDVFGAAEDGEEQTIGGGQATGAHAGTQLTDANATFVTDGVAVGDVIKNISDGSKAAVTSVDSETQLTHAALAGGSENDWDVDDVYAIGVKITTSGAFSRLKEINFTPNGVSAPVSFAQDDVVLGNPTTFLVFAYDTFNEEVSEPFKWRLLGV